MKKAINILITLIIIFSSLIVLNELNKKENPLKNSKIEYSITNDSYFNSLSSNDTWIESTIDNDSNFLFDFLNIKLAITTTEMVSIYGMLQDPDGNWLGYTMNETIDTTAEQEITLMFPGHAIYASGYSGTYLLFIMFQDVDGNPDARLMYTTNSYNFADFERPSAILTGGISDYGFDNDNDSLYNVINIDFQINISESGFYMVAVMLNSNNPFNMSDLVPLGVGGGEFQAGDNQTITASIPTTSMYINKLDGPYTLGFVYLIKAVLADEAILGFQQFCLNYGFTGVYSYLEFDPASAFLTERIFDRPFDTEGDSRYEGVEILVEVNVTDSGTYTLDMDYHMANVSRNTYNHTSLSAGLNNVSFVIPDVRIYSLKLKGSIYIDRLILNDNSEMLHSLVPNYQSQEFDYTEFNPPGLLLTGRYFDEGISTDNDSFFDELKITTEVNVTQNDTYMFDISLGQPVGMWTYNTTYLEVGIHNVSFSYSMADHYKKQVNTSFVVEHISISVEDIGEREQIHFETDVYTTRIYNFTEFDRPSILFTLNFWDYGLDLNNNSFYDVLVIDAEVEVFEPETFAFYGNIKTNTSPTSYFYYTNFQQYLDPGTHVVSLVFDDVQQLDCTFHLDIITARNEAFQIVDQVDDPYDTAYYSYSDFEDVTASTGNFMDYGYSESNTSTFDSIIFAFDITFSQAVYDYTVETTATTSLGYGFGQEINGNFPAGTTRIDFGFDPTTIDLPSWETSFDVSIKVRNDNLQTIFETSYTTRTYSSTEFFPFTTTTEFPEDTTTTEDDDTTSRPSLSPGYTLVISLIAAATIPILTKRRRSEY